MCSDFRLRGRLETLDRFQRRDSAEEGVSESWKQPSSPSAAFLTKARHGHFIRTPNASTGEKKGIISLFSSFKSFIVHSSLPPSLNSD